MFGCHPTTNSHKMSKYEDVKKSNPNYPKAGLTQANRGLITENHALNTLHVTRYYWFEINQSLRAHKNWFDLVDADTGFDLDIILIFFSNNGIGRNELEAAVRGWAAHWRGP
jgi:hypothetical protein